MRSWTLESIREAGKNKPGYVENVLSFGEVRDGRIWMTEENFELLQKALPQKPKGGPGTELKKLFAMIGISEHGNCSCNAHADEMDRRGAEWCRENIETILDWLREECAKRNIPFVEFAARAAVNLAISRAL